MSRPSGLGFMACIPGWRLERCTCTSFVSTALCSAIVSAKIRSLNSPFSRFSILNVQGRQGHPRIFQLYFYSHSPKAQEITHASKDHHVVNRVDMGADGD